MPKTVPVFTREPGPGRFPVEIDGRIFYQIEIPKGAKVMLGGIECVPCSEADLSYKSSGALECLGKEVEN